MPNVFGQSAESKEWAQGFKFPAHIATQMNENIYVCPEEDNLYYLVTAGLRLLNNQMLTFILWLAEWEDKLHWQPCSVYC